MIRLIINNIFLIFNTVAACGLALASLSVLISPEHIWFMPFAGLAFPVLWVLNFFFFLWYLLKRRKKCLLSGFVLLLSAGLAGRFFSISGKEYTAPEGPSDDCFILSYNVRGMNLADKSGVPKEEGVLFDFVIQQNPSVLCFQEFPKKTAQTSIKNQLSGFKNTHIGKKGLFTATIHPIAGIGEIIFPKTRNSCIYTDIILNGDTVRVYNCHLESNKILPEEYYIFDEINLNYDEEQLRDLKSIVRKVKNSSIVRANQVDSVARHINTSPYPVILCGDFNDTPVSFTYQNIKKNLNDAFISSGRGFSISYKRRLLFLRIDYILYDPHMWKAEAYSCPRIYLSDHFPVMTQLSKK